MENFAELWKALPTESKVRQVNSTKARGSTLCAKNLFRAREIGESVENSPIFLPLMQRKTEFFAWIIDRLLWDRGELFHVELSRLRAGSKNVSRGTFISHSLFRILRIQSPSASLNFLRLLSLEAIQIVLYIGG